MFYIISFEENTYLDYRYLSKCNIVVMTHCLFSAKRWKSKSGVYIVARHLPKAFRDFVVIYQVDYSLPIPMVVCRWNLSAFSLLEVQGV